MMLSGTCKGGPFNGKPLHHPEERCFLFKRAGKLITFHWDGASDLPEDVQAGAYEWDDGCWQWTREV